MESYVYWIQSCTINFASSVGLTCIYDSIKSFHGFIFEVEHFINSFPAIVFRSLIRAAKTGYQLSDDLWLVLSFGLPYFLEFNYHTCYTVLVTYFFFGVELPFYTFLTHLKSFLNAVVVCDTVSRLQSSQTVRLWKKHHEINTMIKHASKKLQNDWVLQRPLALDESAPSTLALPCHCRMNSLPPPPHPLMFAAFSPQISHRLQLITFRPNF